MSESSRSDLTQLLLAWSDGDQQALEQLIPVVYRELRRLAKRYMEQERPGHTLQATALVNEAYLRLFDLNKMRWQNRAHFFAVSAQMMRRILVEYARRKNRVKRGDGAAHLELDEAVMVVQGKTDTGLVAIDDALSALTAENGRLGQVVELRFFGGLTMEETAEVLKVSSDTVMRDWKQAKAWLLRYLSCNIKPS
jgi:RNA polymerase sigma-70 factor (ECF subfamily)